MTDAAGRLTGEWAAASNASAMNTANLAQRESQYNRSAADQSWTRDLGALTDALRMNQGDRQYWGGLGEESRRFDANFGESARQYDISTGEDSRRFDAGLAFDDRKRADELSRSNQDFRRDIIGNVLQWLLPSQSPFEKAMAKQPARNPVERPKYQAGGATDYAPHWQW